MGLCQLYSPQTQTQYPGRKAGWEGRWQVMGREELHLGCDSLWEQEVGAY